MVKETDRFEILSNSDAELPAVAVGEGDIFEPLVSSKPHRLLSEPRVEHFFNRESNQSKT